MSGAASLIKSPQPVEVDQALAYYERDYEGVYPQWTQHVSFTWTQVFPAGRLILVEHAAPAAVRFQCADGEGGTLSILLIVRDTRFVPDFPFDTFEGPDATTNGEPLFRVEVGSESVGFGFDLPIGGWYLEQYAFVFGHAALNGTDSQVAHIADDVRQGATTMTVGVAMPDGADRWLLATVPMTNAVAAVAKAMEPCR